MRQRAVWIHSINLHAQEVYWPWPFAFFMNCIDVCGVAAYVVWTTLYPDWNSQKHIRHEFLIEMAEVLIKLQIEQRSTHGLQKGTLSAIAHYSGDQQAGAMASPAEKREKNRCHICPHKRARKQRQSCNDCKKSVCSEYSAVKRICQKCRK